MPQLNCVILAAGKGTRMRSKKPKIAHAIMGKPMVRYVAAAAKQLRADRTIVVTGHEKAVVEECLREDNVLFALQAEQKGTAHALLTAEQQLVEGDILVLYGDVPLIQSSALHAFIEFFHGTDGIAFMTTTIPDPKGYGRVIVGTDGEIMDIVEDSEATGDVRNVTEINTGICMIRRDRLDLVKAVKPDNSKGEYYLTDICKTAKEKGVTVKAYHYAHAHQVLGINTRRELMEAQAVMKNAILDRHMASGVTIMDRNTYIEDQVTIGADTVIYPDSYLMGATAIGEDCVIGPHAIIRESTIGNGVTIEPFSSLDGVRTEEGVKIGPFSRIRPTTVIKAKAKIGNFVEVKNATIEKGSKASHLSYIGDATVGSGVNIGAGTITCNYDGKNKHKTTIEDGVFVGSNTELVAPVTIGKDAIIGAGSTITHDVPEGALAVSRTKQRNIEGYSRRKK